jgi:hypothetical protein
MSASRFGVYRLHECILDAITIVIKASSGDGNVYLMADVLLQTENVAALELEMPQRTTEDYTATISKQKLKIGSQVRSVLNA